VIPHTETQTTLLLLFCFFIYTYVQKNNNVLASACQFPVTVQIVRPISLASQQRLTVAQTKHAHLNVSHAPPVSLSKAQPKTGLWHLYLCYSCVCCDADNVTRIGCMCVCLCLYAVQCKQYEKQAVAGSLCAGLCDLHTIHLSSCTLSFHGFRVTINCEHYTSRDTFKYIHTCT